MQQYDNTLKELFQHTPRQLLKLLVKAEAQELLTVEYPKVRMRKPDLVVRLKDGRIYHLELQSDHDPNMVWRMLEYYTLIYQLFQQTPIQQVLYVGSDSIEFQEKLEVPNLSFYYEVVDIRSIDCQKLLMSNVLEDNLLAVLCRLDDETENIKKILQKITALSENERTDAMIKLLVLTGLRKHLQPLILEESKHMSIAINVMENPFLKNVFIDGQSKGVQQGIQQSLRKILEKRFGKLPLWVNQKLEVSSVETLQKWEDRALEVDKLEAVFE